MIVSANRMQCKEKQEDFFLAQPRACAKVKKRGKMRRRFGCLGFSS